MDWREVCMVNNFIPHAMTMTISTNPNITRSKPESVLYNSKIGGVDDVGKVLKPNQSIRKSLKWYKTYFHLFDLAVYNELQTYKIIHPQSKRQFKAFLESIIKEIIHKYPTVPSIKGRPSSLTYTIDARTTGNYLPSQIPSAGKPDHGQCYLCSRTSIRKTTSFRCMKCGKWLCVGGCLSCFQKSHTNSCTPRAE